MSASDFSGYFTYCPFVFFFFFIFQTWRTSRLTEEALSPSVKVKEWFCCVALHHTLEVKQTIHPYFLRLFNLVGRRTHICVKLEIRSHVTEKQNMNEMVIL